MASAPRANVGDRSWAALLTALGLSVLAVGFAIILSLLKLSGATIHQTGIWAFVHGTDWDPTRDSFGALPFIYGTLVTSAVALAVALPIGLGLSILLTEVLPARWRGVLSFPLGLLAGIPSVVYGLWGLFVVVPLLRDPVEPALGRWLGFLPLFRGPPLGLGYLSAGLLLAIMILPTIASMSMEVLSVIPNSLREAALALGATRWEMIRLAVLPPARAGILGATILGLGRALGETMAVTMVIGNNPIISSSLFAPGYTLPAVIANEFAEASGSAHTGALAALGLILFAVTLLLNTAARLLLRLVTRGPATKVAA